MSWLERFPLDCWGTIMRYFNTVGDFHSLCLVIRGLREYVSLHPQCTSNIWFNLHKKPQFPHPWISNLRIIKRCFDLNQFHHEICCFGQSMDLFSSRTFGYTFSRIFSLYPNLSTFTFNFDLWKERSTDHDSESSDGRTDTRMYFSHFTFDLYCENFFSPIYLKTLNLSVSHCDMSILSTFPSLETIQIIFSQRNMDHRNSRYGFCEKLSSLYIDWNCLPRIRKLELCSCRLKNRMHKDVKNRLQFICLENTLVFENDNLIGCDNLTELKLSGFSSNLLEEYKTQFFPNVRSFELHLFTPIERGTRRRTYVTPQMSKEYELSFVCRVKEGINPVAFPLAERIIFSEKYRRGGNFGRRRSQSAHLDGLCLLSFCGFRFVTHLEFHDTVTPILFELKPILRTLIIKKSSEEIDCKNIDFEKCNLETLIIESSGFGEGFFSVLLKILQNMNIFGNEIRNFSFKSIRSVGNLSKFPSFALMSLRSLSNLEEFEISTCGSYFRVIEIVDCPKLKNVTFPVFPDLHEYHFYSIPVLKLLGISVFTHRCVSSFLTNHNFFCLSERFSITKEPERIVDGDFFFEDEGAEDDEVRGINEQNIGDKNVLVGSHLGKVKLLHLYGVRRFYLDGCNVSDVKEGSDCTDGNRKTTYVSQIENIFALDILHLDVRNLDNLESVSINYDIPYIGNFERFAEVLKFRFENLPSLRQLRIRNWFAYSFHFERLEIRNVPIKRLVIDMDDRISGSNFYFLEEEKYTDKFPEFDITDEFFPCVEEILVEGRQFIRLMKNLRKLRLIDVKKEYYHYPFVNCVCGIDLENVRMKYRMDRTFEIVHELSFKEYIDTVHQKYEYTIYVEEENDDEDYEDGLTGVCICQ